MRYVRLRTFNKHRTKDCWYPTKRFYMIPLDSAAALGEAIVAASKGKPCGPEPKWWTGFEEQYEVFQSRDKNAADDQALPRIGFENGCGFVVGA